MGDIARCNRSNVTSSQVLCVTIATPCGKQWVNKTMLLPCHQTQTDLDINGTSNLLRQFNSATDVTFHGSEKLESVFIVVKIIPKRRVLYFIFDQ